ncbi:RING-H2 finger protein ATL46 [Dichanthelium oligosanthes]|uniref:RING-type E3 ubiquitin transferase n=1 Tax=Dichanthelium oligosanthes TaxID=888268 RepID=A0A1E5V576_9POAL|nr:RING-H2 finger protein ATL46 [Dichanthelium oligosanthes]
MGLLIKKQHGRAAAMGESAASRDAAMDRQLQQLFNLHDSGLDQAFIDALPVFAYREIIGGNKEPFNCAVCLCEFHGEDRLRLLPVCGHAFHLQCIDTWLLSNSTCPLCRGTLFVPGMTIDNLMMFDFDERLETVSYTHLDVYKRQTHGCCPIRHARFGTLFVPGMTIDNLMMFDFDERLEEEPLPEECEDGFQVSRQKPIDEE